MLSYFWFLTFFLLQEWHAQQIASGEAKDNANFQPLGGDWYESKFARIFYNQLAESHILMLLLASYFVFRNCCNKNNKFFLKYFFCHAIS